MLYDIALFCISMHHAALHHMHCIVLCI